MPTVLNRHFARHYVEMVVVMFLGMAVLGCRPAGRSVLWARACGPGGRYA
jgi:hypothetical protein